jgi:hypothetical protein
VGREKVRLANNGRMDRSLHGNRRKIGKRKDDYYACDLQQFGYYLLYCLFQLLVQMVRRNLLTAIQQVSQHVHHVLNQPNAFVFLALRA